MECVPQVQLLNIHLIQILSHIENHTFDHHTIKKKRTNLWFPLYWNHIISPLFTICKLPCIEYCHSWRCFTIRPQVSCHKLPYLNYLNLISQYIIVHHRLPDVDIIFHHVSPHFTIFLSCFQQKGPHFISIIQPAAPPGAGIGSTSCAPPARPGASLLRPATSPPCAARCPVEAQPRARTQARGLENGTMYARISRMAMGQCVKKNGKKNHILIGHCENIDHILGVPDVWAPLPLESLEDG